MMATYLEIFLSVFLVELSLLELLLFSSVVLFLPLFFWLLSHPFHAQLSLVEVAARAVSVFELAPLPIPSVSLFLVFRVPQLLASTVPPPASQQVASSLVLLLLLLFHSLNLLLAVLSCLLSG